MGRVRYDDRLTRMTADQRDELKRNLVMRHGRDITTIEKEMEDMRKGDELDDQRDAMFTDRLLEDAKQSTAMKQSMVPTVEKGK